MRVEFEITGPEQEPRLLRVAVSQRNLVTMIVKFDDPTSVRHVIGADVRVCQRDTTPGQPPWIYDDSGWLMHLRGVERQDLHHSITVSVDRQRRRVTLAVDRQGLRHLLAQVRDSQTNPFDEQAPTVICETDRYHYGSRGLGPGLMAPQHEAQIQELGGMPGDWECPSSKG
jgi:hypothetical protein